MARAFHCLFSPHLGHQDAVLEPLNSPARHFDLELECISTSQHTALKIVKIAVINSQADVLQDHWLEGDLRDNKY